MIQIRHRNGEATLTDDAVAVEFVDSVGKLAAVITQNIGSINFLTPGDPVFNAYARIHNFKISKVTIHEPTASKSTSI